MSGTGSVTPASGTASDNVDNLTELNSAAWHALLGMSISWENDLIALLRSDEPIHHWVRSTLASLIAGESKHGLALKMSGHKRLRDATLAVEARSNWVRIGNWITNLIDGGSTRQAAIENASHVFSQSWELCGQAYDYRNRYQRWRGNLPDSHPFFGFMSELGIERMFHQMVHYGEPLDEADGLERAAKLVTELSGQSTARES